MTDLLIANGRVIDPKNGVDRVTDVLIRDGRVAGVGDGLAQTADGTPVYDATGLVVAPGFIDPHVHLRDPGFEWKETIESGARAAVAGGFTAVACMPNTNPVLDEASRIEYVIRKARAAGLAHIFPVGAITKGQKGEELAVIGEMVEAGAVAFTDDGHPVMNAELMRCAMLYATHFDVPILDHCEDKNLSAEGVMNLGRVSSILGLRGMAGAAEDVQVARDIILSEMTGAHVHIMHISTAASVDLVRRAKARGLRVTAEASPHHFTLTDEAVRESNYDTNTKMSPPLRTAADREAIIEGLKDGTIECIATDHAPHHEDDKEVEYQYAAFGIVGLETAVSLALDRLVHPGHLTLGELVTRMSWNPARLLRLTAKGHLGIGADGDVTILDPSRRVTVDARRFYSKSRNTPFDGWTLTGAPVATVVGGRVVMSGGTVVDGVAEKTGAGVLS